MACVSVGDGRLWLARYNREILQETICKTPAKDTNFWYPGLSAASGGIVAA
jgi:hypothetical protein